MIRSINTNCHRMHHITYKESKKHNFFETYIPIKSNSNQNNVKAQVKDLNIEIIYWNVCIAFNF